MLKEELFITASLARLELDESEAEKFNEAVTKMIEYFSIMDKADVDALVPTTHAVIKDNRTREDVPALSLLAEKLVENAPVKEGSFIVVPNIL